ncbi:ATP-dependent Clp protease ATP-binding subunit CLPT1, chloroplastic-like [Phalaenopsis equestris]|uniref:ATP-dependent Clp protease ATP-binding subunit CLPT1, chloroplastic-like n=1 Tax=Phalaenopsis equestris TaxID=78828 RepID=UPI0009E656DE|nr:ATP-dependent Clp protease ATP-binding subunit CLPT1, chloroplastic-like [Phalaenopsis equestris]
MAARAFSIISSPIFPSSSLTKKPTIISSTSSLSLKLFSSYFSPLSGSLFGESVYQSFRPRIVSTKQSLLQSAMVLSVLPTAKSDRASADKIPKWSARSIKSFGMAELEARKLKYPNTGTEALLMGILVEGTSRAARFLRENGITLFKVREETVKLLGKSDMYFFSPEHPPLTEPAQRALDWAVDEKIKSGEGGEITTTHMLLGIWSEKESAGHKILASLGFDDAKASELAKYANDEFSLSYR